MKIVIISDIHDNIVNLEKCLSWCDKRGIEEMICCGDLTNSETLKFLSNKFRGPIHLVSGNVEIYQEAEIKKYKNIKYYGKAGKAEIGGKIIGACHEPYLVDKIINRGGCGLVFYGHTHKPWIEERGNVKIINPGVLGGMFSKATFAVWNTSSGDVSLKILEALKV